MSVRKRQTAPWLALVPALGIPLAVMLLGDAPGDRARRGSQKPEAPAVQAVPTQPPAPRATERPRLGVGPSPFSPLVSSSRRERTELTRARAIQTRAAAERNNRIVLRGSGVNRAILESRLDEIRADRARRLEAQFEAVAGAAPTAGSLEAAAPPAS